ncbi:MAG: hypothetical protein CMD65_03525 [Gammaproteobacteria bacterium]|nr:hypothetical protein [Gammaproteobacteria bacterium]|tara:strand:+ start:843 stop:2639 length:1797 start_codon:yes stop_codon:yes gene_type:complete
MNYNNIHINRIFKILDNKDQIYLIFIFVLAFLSGLLEIAGIASIIPFIGIISDPQYLENKEYLTNITNYLGYDYNDSRIFFGVLSIVLFISINLYNIFYNWKTVMFTAYLESKMSAIVLKKYLDQSYSFFVNSNPSVLIKNVLDESSQLCTGFIYPYIEIIARIMILTLISILLFNVNYKLFIGSTLLISIIYLLIYRFLKNTMSDYGEKKIILNSLRFKTVKEVFDNLKDVKFYSIEDYYTKMFSKSASDFSLNAGRAAIYQTIPRYIIEIILFGGVFLSIIYLISSNSSLVSYLPTISVFILAAYRSIPMLQNIFVNLTNVKLNYPVLKIVEDAINLNQKKPIINETIPSLQNSIRFENITFGYKNNNNIIDSLSFKIQKGGMTSIIGTTGIGKTTLIDIFLGFYNQKNGYIKIDDNIVTDENRANLLKSIGYVSQTTSLQQKSIAENIAVGIDTKHIDYDRIKKVSKILELDELIKHLDDSYETDIGEKGVKISGGQRQKIGIARALYLQPSILILDESTNALDTVSESRIIKNIKKFNKDITIIMITHRLSALKLSDTILMLKNNKMFNLKLSDKKNLNEIDRIINDYDERNKC